jgi:hypothetical protein
MPSRTPSAPPVWCRPALAKHRCSTTFSLFKIVIGTAVVLAPGNPLGGCFLYQFFEGNYGLIHPSNTGGRGVAFFAHVGGFIFGAVVAGFLSGRDASPSRRHDGRQRRSVRRDGPVMPALPDDGKVRHREPPPPAGLWLDAWSAGRRRLSGDTNLGDHNDFRGPGVQRCNRLGTNVIPGTTRYLLGVFVRTGTGAQCCAP